MGIIIPTTINIESMNIQETSRVYNLLYKLQYISTSGVILKLEDISIMEYASYYKIIIKHKDSIDLLRNIERYLLSKIPDYRCAVKNNNSNHYITIKKNSNTTSIIKKYDNKTIIYINLLKVIKSAFYSYLIIYIL